MAYLVRSRRLNPATGNVETYFRIGWREGGGRTGKQQTCALGFVSPEMAALACAEAGVLPPPPRPARVPAQKPPTVLRGVPVPRVPVSGCGWVYFIQRWSGGPIKVGYSAAPDSRYRTLQTAHAAPLRMLLCVRGDKADEAAAHAFLAKDRASGEWFHPHQAARRLLAAWGGPRLSPDGGTIDGVPRWSGKRTGRV